MHILYEFVEVELKNFVEFVVEKVHSHLAQTKLI